MAGRPCKVGLDYFELDCLLDDDIKLIQAEFGLKGFAVIVKLYQKIYGQRGYYCEFDRDTLLLFMSENGLASDSENLIKEIVAACIRRGIFSEKLFKKYGILTSSGVQKRYLNATSKREVVNLKKEYLLISVGKNNKNVVINSINDGRNSINSVDNTQSREEKSKKDICADEPHDTLLEDFEKIYSIYPKKVGKTIAFGNYKQWVSSSGKMVNGKKIRLTNRQIYFAVRKYVKHMEESEKDMQYWKNFDTLMGRQLLDYIDSEVE